MTFLLIYDFFPLLSSIITVKTTKWIISDTQFFIGSMFILFEKEVSFIFYAISHLLIHV